MIFPDVIEIVRHAPPHIQIRVVFEQLKQGEDRTRISLNARSLVAQGKRGRVPSETRRRTSALGSVAHSLSRASVAS